MKKTIVIAAAVCSAFAFYTWRPDPEFSFQAAASSNVSHQIWNRHPLSPQERHTIRAALSQTFSYIGSGAQAYVFFSVDGTSVLKLFKKKRFQVPLWVRCLPPLPYKVKKMASKRANLIKDFTSYQIAFDKLQEETGLLLVHLDNRPDVDQAVTLVDHLKRPYQVNLNDYAFILQRRGELVDLALDHLVKQGNLPAAKEALTSLLHLLKDRCDKGVADRDPNLSKNFAFIDGKAVQIDIGRFSYTDIKTPNISSEFKAKLYRLSPELLEHFEKEYQSVFKHSF